MKIELRRVVAICCAGLLLGSISCSGGGGGGGGGAQGRTTGTGLRILHGSVDEVPVSVFINGKEIQRAHYAEITRFDGFPSGNDLISVQGVNAPEISFLNAAKTFQPKTEYTVLVYGSSRSGRASIGVFEEPIVRPVAGRARIQIVNSYDGFDSISASSSVGGDLGSASFGNVSGYTEVPSGAQTITVSHGRGQVAVVNLIVEDRSDLTLMVTGSQSLGVTFVPAYTDFD